jgi:flagellar biosynthesis regulator FlaF
MKARRLDNERLFTAIWTLNELAEKAFAALEQADIDDENIMDAIDGNRYFIEMIDSCTRKSDAIPIERKANIIPELSR